MKTSEIINEIRNSKVGVMSIILKDASRYAANAEGEMVWAGTLFTKKYADRQDGDEVITTGNKETNLSEVKRVLTSLIGKGEVQVRLMNANWLTGEIEPDGDYAPQKMTWDEYNASEQNTYLDEDNAADQDVVHSNDTYEVRVFKTFSNESGHYFSGEDEDFVIVDSKDGSQESYLLYGCTLEDAINYIEE